MQRFLVGDQFPERAYANPCFDHSSGATSCRTTNNTVSLLLVEARRKVADNRKVATALAKAATELEVSRWYFTGEILVISSRTTVGKKYRVTGTTCECSAHGPAVCWHKVAHRLLTRAATQPVP